MEGNHIIRQSEQEDLLTSQYSDANSGKQLDGVSPDCARVPCEVSLIVSHFPPESRARERDSRNDCEGIESDVLY
jgi:hypothetical protein